MKESQRTLGAPPEHIFASRSSTVNRIREIQSGLEEGDQVVIWKDEYQISKDGNVPTNYGNMTKAIQKRIERILASAKMKKVQLINSEDFDALDNEDSYQLGELNGVIGTLEELLILMPNFKKKGE